jgi:hypothetical protein
MQTGCSPPSSPPNPAAWVWDSRSAGRSSMPMGAGCGRPRASRGVLSFSLRSPLTEPPSVIDVACWHFSDFARSAAVVRDILTSGHRYSSTTRTSGRNIARRHGVRCPPANRSAIILAASVIFPATIDPTGKSLLIFRNRVKTGNQKYFASAIGQITDTDFSIPSHSEGRRPSSRTLGRVAVDVEVPLTNGIEAYGEVVWS